MPEIPNVIPTDPVASEWGNDIRDRTVQRYASVAGRTGLHPTPDAGDLSYLADTGAVEVFHGGVWRGMLPVATVLPYAGISPPAGFLVCNGAAVSRSTYAALYAAVGTTFGAGDGSTTFNLPDLRGRFPIGLADSGLASTLGESGGTLAGHSHAGPSHTHDGGNSATDGGGADTGPPDVSLAHSHGVTVNSGGSHSHSFSDTTSSVSSPSQAVASGAVVAVADTSTHSHSVSGTTGSGGTHSHTATSTSELGIHRHDIPSHSHDLGATGASGTGATTAATAVPPFLTVHYIIRT